MASFSSQVVRSLLWQGGGQLVAQVLSWIATVVVIRLLTPGDYGLMAMAYAFLGFFLVFADLGFGAATIQARELEPAQIRRLLGVVLVTNAGACALTVLAAPWVASFFGEPRLVLVLRVISINFVLLAAYVIPQSQLVRELDFRAKAKVDVGAVVAAAAVSLGLAVAGLGVWALVAGSIAMHGVKAVAYNVLRPVALVPLFSLNAVTPLARFGALVALDRLVYFVHTQSDIVIGGKVLGKEDLGLYTVAGTLAALPLEKILPTVTQVSFAAFSRIQDDAARVGRNFLRAVRLVSLACFPAFLGLAAVAGDLVPVILGERWAGLVVPVQVICLVLPFKALTSLLTPPLFGVGRPSVVVANNSISLVVMTAAFLVGVRYGVIGLCLASLIAFPWVFLVVSVRSLRILKLPYQEFLRAVRFAAVASGVMAALVLLLRQVLAASGPSGWRLAVLVAAGVTVYGVLLALFQRRELGELLATTQD